MKSTHKLLIKGFRLMGLKVKELGQFSCNAVKSRIIERLEGFPWEKFLGFLVSKFLGFLVSKFLGFEVSWFRNLSVTTFQRLTKCPFHVFWRILIPYPNFQQFIWRIVGICSGACLFQYFHFLEIPKLEIYDKSISETYLGIFLDCLRYPGVSGVSKDTHKWFWGSGTRPKIPKS